MEEIADFLGDRPAAPIYRAMAAHYAALAADHAAPAADSPVAQLKTFFRRDGDTP
jgi:hypothetical protein